MVKVPIWAFYRMNSCVQPEQDPPVYYSIVILTILYYLRVADLMEITSPYPREKIIAGNYILADTRAYLSKRHRQQNEEILIRHSPGIGECFLFLSIQLTGKNKRECVKKSGDSKICSERRYETRKESRYFCFV